VVLDSSAVVERECDVRATSSGNLEEIKPLCLFLFLACLFRGVRSVTAALALWLSLGASIGLTMAQSSIEDSRLQETAQVLQQCLQKLQMEPITSGSCSSRGVG